MWRLSGLNINLILSNREIFFSLKKRSFITNKTSEAGIPKIINQCTFPLTGKNVVKKIYTNLAIIDVKEDRLFIKELAPNIDFDFVQKHTEATLFQYEKNNPSLWIQRVIT